MTAREKIVKYLREIPPAHLTAQELADNIGVSLASVNDAIPRLLETRQIHIADIKGNKRCYAVNGEAGSTPFQASWKQAAQELVPDQVRDEWIKFLDTKPSVNDIADWTWDKARELGVNPFDFSGALIVGVKSFRNQEAA